MPDDAPCPFCTLPAERVWLESGRCIAVKDLYPVAEGHTLVIPRHHVESVFELPHSVLREGWEYLTHVRLQLQAECEPTVYHVGRGEGGAGAPHSRSGNGPP